MIAANIADYRSLAQKRLPHFLFEYIDGGSYAQQTLHWNTADLQSLRVRQRVLRDVSKIDLSTTLLGRAVKLPVALAPIGLAGMNARRGEVQAARAATAAGVPFCLSTVGICPIAEVAAAITPEKIWFQLYMVRDRAFMRDLLAEAAAQGVDTLFFTVDLPMPGARYRDVRSGMAAAPSLAGKLRRFAQVATRPRWAFDVGLRGGPHTLGNIPAKHGARTSLLDFLAWIGANFDPSVTWDELDFIRANWSGKIVIKGIMEAADATRAAELGAHGIVVSNHGGRQLDGVPSAVQVLPEITQAVGGRLSVLADGGIRSGLDVVRMLALGAEGVLLGRAWAFALAGAGEAGVAHMLRLIRAEMSIALALTGCTRIADVTADILYRAPAGD